MIYYNLNIEPWVTKTYSRDYIIIINISLLIHKIFNDYEVYTTWHILYLVYYL